MERKVREGHLKSRKKDADNSTRTVVTNDLKKKKTFAGYVFLSNHTAGKKSVAPSPAGS
jgi:hypothetical protein